MNDKAINERAQHLLKVLIERYIREGQPVGSRTLAEDTALALSPATIRNVLADLEESGYLVSPHTSAGRIPTAQGYRLFVDTLLTIKPLNQLEVEQVKNQLKPEFDMNNLLAQASTLLSEITQMTGLVTIPRRERLVLHHIEFLPLSAKQILVILVLNDREIQNRIIYTEREFTRSELQQATNYLNSLYAGRELLAVRRSVMKAMQEDHHHMNQLMQEAMEVADQVFDKTQAEEDYVMAGQTHLLNVAADTGDFDHLRQLFEAFSQKRDILHLLDKCLYAQGIQIFIGEESGYDVLDSCSIVTAPYSIENQIIGVLAVIGPTRMAYERIIPAVDLTSKLLTAALNLPQLSPNK